jgi:hypothetical protein
LGSVHRAQAEVVQRTTLNSLAGATLLTCWASKAARRAGRLLRPSYHWRPGGLFLYRSQGRIPASPLGARRAGRRRSRHAGIGGDSDQGMRWGALRPGQAPSSPLQGTLLARRPAAPGRRHARDAARRACVGLHWWRRRGHGTRGCGRPALAFSSTCYTSPRHKGRFTAQDTKHRGGSPSDGAASTGSPAHRPGRLPRMLLTTAVGHGPGSALGCAGSATVLSL